MNRFGSASLVSSPTSPEGPSIRNIHGSMPSTIFPTALHINSENNAARGENEETSNRRHRAAQHFHFSPAAQQLQQVKQQEQHQVQQQQVQVQKESNMLCMYEMNQKKENCQPLPATVASASHEMALAALRLGTSTATTSTTTATARSPLRDHPSIASDPILRTAMEMHWMGLHYFCRQQFDLALDHFHLALRSCGSSTASINSIHNPSIATCAGVIWFSIALVQYRGNSSDMALYSLQRSIRYLRLHHNEALQWHQQHQQQHQQQQMPAMADPMNHLVLALHFMGRILYENGDFDSALIACKDCIHLCRAVHGDCHLDVSIGLYNFGLILYKVGHVEDALDHLSIYIKRAMAEDGSSSSSCGIATALHNMGIMHIDNGSVRKGISLLQMALKTRCSNLGQNDANVGETAYRLGRALHDVGQFDEAMEHFQCALRIMTQSNINTNTNNNDNASSSNEDMATLLCVMGMTHHARGDNARALQFFYRTLRMATYILGDLDEVVACLHGTIGNLQLELGEVEYARDSFRDASRIVEELRGMDLASGGVGGRRRGNESGINDATATRVGSSLSSILLNTKWHPCAPAA